MVRKRRGERAARAAMVRYLVYIVGYSRVEGGGFYDVDGRLAWYMLFCRGDKVVEYLNAAVAGE